MRVIEKMNILEIAKSITKEDIYRSTLYMEWVTSQLDYKEETTKVINELGFKYQAQIDAIFFMKWLEQNHDEIP